MIKPLLLFTRRFYIFWVVIGCLGQYAAHAQNEVETARNYLQTNFEKYRLVSTDVSDMRISSAYLSPTTGWYHVYFNQNHQGVDVYNAIANVVINQGNVSYSNTSFVRNIAAQANFDKPVISPLQALGAVAADLKLSLGQPREVSRTNFPNGGVTSATYLDEGVSEGNIPIKLYWLETESVGENNKIATKVQLVWNVRVEMKGYQNIWNVHVDALTGQIVEKRDDVIHCYFGMKNHTTAPHICALEPSAKKGVTATPASALGTTPNAYNVFDYPIESPIYGSLTTVIDPYTKFVPAGTGPGATNGWHNDGTTDYTTTQGNNVWAQEDVNNDDGTGASPTSAILNFEFPYVTGVGSKAAKQNAAITNLFYWNNLLHDVLWKYGFDEPSGNFQNNNQGRGGAGNDYIYADAQDGGGLNNANFYPPADGEKGRMQMYMWNQSATDDLDGDFDNGVIAHEYGHGWSTRLTGGPANSGCLNNYEQGGEGWSDYVALMLTTKWNTLSPNVASANLSRGIGNYVLNYPTTGGGIRQYPYSYDLAVNGAVTYGKVATYIAPHGVGSIWATMLWDMTWEIIMQDNQIVNNIFDLPTNVADMRGNLAALKLVNEGLRLQPCSPSFIDARDAIFAADALLFGGRYRCAIGRAFARRGLGAYASTGASSNDNVVVEDFTPFFFPALTSSRTPPAICSNTAFNYTSTIAETGSYTYNWSRATIAGISNAASSGASATINETLINTTTSPVTVEYQVVVSPDACGGIPQPQKVRVVVNPSPIPTVGSYAVCQNGSVPVGEGLKVPKTNFNFVTGQLTTSSPTYRRGDGNNTTVYTASNVGTSVYYKTYTFTPSVSESVTFETTDGALTFNRYDTYLTLYQTSFNPSSPATNFLRGDDDSGALRFASKFTHSLVAGTTYVLVVSTYNNGRTGSFKISTSSAVFEEGTNSWYNVNSGGTALATGELFNPVGVANSGISNTATAGTYTYYVSINLYDACRTSTTFTIDPVHTVALSSAPATESQTVCINSGITSITYTLGGGATGADVTGLPAGVTKSVSGSTLTISGIPTESGTFNYNIVTTGNSCTTASKSGSIVVTSGPTLTLTSSVGTNAQTVCINTGVTSITYAIGGSATGASVSGLPAGMTGSVSSGVLTISGIPTELGTFNYTVTSSGGVCSAATATGSLVVNPVHTIALSSAPVTESQTVCINSGLTSITYTLGGGATGANVTGLPAGVTKSVSGTTLTISGIPTQSGTFNYNIVTTGNSCTTATKGGTINVVELPTIVLTSAAGTNIQTLCANTPITMISYGLGGGATGALATGLPSGVTANVVGKVLTISGAPAVGGLFNYTVTTTGVGCTPVSLSGTLNVNLSHSAVLSSSPSTEPQTVCLNTNLIPIMYTLSNGATGANVTGLPAGVSSSVSGGVVTISGQPTASGVFTFTLTTTGNTCTSVTKTGTIRVQTKPTISLGINGESFKEGTTATLCDIDANPSNVLTKNITTGCVVGSPVWRVQVGTGEWSGWTSDAPSSQPSDNKVYKYQSACDASCSSTYTSVISLTVNYRASQPANVSLVADGVQVTAGETKTICNAEGTVISFTATCGVGEGIVYSTDGGDYVSGVPSQQEDGQLHTYRVRCRKLDGIVSCVETESAPMSLVLTPLPQAPTASLSPASGCGSSVALNGSASCGSLTTVWYDASTNQALLSLPSMTPSESKSYYARCKNAAGCLGSPSTVVTFTYTPLGAAPVVSATNDVVCTGTSVELSTNCPSGTSVVWNDNVTQPTLSVSFTSVTTQSYSARCKTVDGCMSGWSAPKLIQWQAFDVTLINVGSSKSGIKPGSGVAKSAWETAFITRDGGPVLEWSTQTNPTLYFTENLNKTAPRYWTIHVDACILGTNGSLTFNMLATPEVGVPRSFNTHENNAPYLMYANRDGFTELYAQNHPAYGFYEDNGAGGNVYDEGLPKGLYKLGIRYWSEKGQGSIYPSTRQPQGNVLAYQEYWFRIQSKNGIGVGAARVAADLDPSGMTKGAFAEVMPNPVSKQMHLRIQQVKGQSVRAELLDVMGRLVLERKFVPETQSHQEEFEVEKLVEGVYLLRVSTPDKQTTLKVIKL